MSSMTLDPSTGDYVHTTPWRFMVTLVDDAMYMGLVIYIYHATGMKKIFLTDNMRMESHTMQALRYGIMFGTMLELRRWLDAYGISTNVSQYLESLMKIFS